METDDKNLINRIWDLAEMAAGRNMYLYSSFLTPAEQSQYLSVKNELPVSSMLIGSNRQDPDGTGDNGSAENSIGKDSCIRKLIRFGSPEEFGYEWESPIRVLNIRPVNEKFARECTHRDYLGSLMALGLERKVTGDIIVRGKEAWVYVLETAAEFIAENLHQVRHTEVICEIVEEEVPELAPRFEHFTSNIASERMDLIVGAAAGLKREQAKLLLDAEKVFVNGRAVTRAGHKITPGDELVIRGFGKYIFDGVEITTKKGRLVVAFRKYC